MKKKLPAFKTNEEAACHLLPKLRRFGKKPLKQPHRKTSARSLFRTFKIANQQPEPQVRPEQPARQARQCRLQSLRCSAVQRSYPRELSWLAF